MQECRPYTSAGELSSHVVKQIFARGLSKKPLTGENMLKLNYDDITAKATSPHTAESSHPRGTADPVQRLEEASPSLRKCTLNAGDPVSSTTSDDEDSCGSLNSSPVPRKSFRMHACSRGNLRDIKQTSQPPYPIEVDLEKAASAVAANLEEVRVKMEPSPEMVDPFPSEVEGSECHEIYHDESLFWRSGLAQLKPRASLTLPQHIRSTPSVA